MIDATDILNSEVFQDTIDTIHARLLDEFERTTPNSADALQDVSYRLGALKVILSELRQQLPKSSVNLKHQS